MSDLVVIAYEDEDKAEQVRQTLLKLEREYLIDLEDAVVATKTRDGQIRLNQATNLTAAGVVEGGFWGTLVGMLFLSPLLGAAAGAAAGAISGALADVGIEDQFMRELSEQLDPGSSALFVLVRKSTPDKVLAEIKRYGGRVLRTSLSHEDEAMLQAVLDESRNTNS